MRIMRFFLVFIGLFLTVNVIADDLTAEQEAFRSSLMQFLKEEGFSPKIDEENSLTFKKEGVLYWLDFGGSSPIYLEFHRAGLNCDDANLEVVVKACNHANQTIRCAKAIMGKTSVSFAVEMYCHSVEEFKYVFYKNMDTLDGVYEAVKEYYDENNNSSVSSSAVPFSIQSIAVANVENDGTIIDNYGSMIFDFNTKYIKPRFYTKVNVSGSYDIYVKFYTPSGLSTGSDSPSGYSFMNTIDMTQGTKYYYASGWGGKSSGHWKEGTYRLEFYYRNKKIGEYSFIIH